MSATPPQRNFVNNLIAQKGVTNRRLLDDIYEMMSRADVPPTEISKVINKLMAMPDAERSAPAEAGSPRRPSVDEYLRTKDVALAYYAIPVEDLTPGLASYANGNSHLFVQVNEFKGTRYARKLTGAPGSFTRTRLNDRTHYFALADVIARNQLRYTQLFGSLYSCCGKCQAELTDDTSRKLKLGPHCRKAFGL